MDKETSKIVGNYIVSCIDNDKTHCEVTHGIQKTSLAATVGDSIARSSCHGGGKPKVAAAQVTGKSRARVRPCNELERRAMAASGSQRA